MTNKLLFNLSFANSTKTDLPAPGVPPVTIPSGFVTGVKFLLVDNICFHIFSVILTESASVNFFYLSISANLSSILNTF